VCLPSTINCSRFFYSFLPSFLPGDSFIPSFLPSWRYEKRVQEYQQGFSTRSGLVCLIVHGTIAGRLPSVAKSLLDNHVPCTLLENRISGHETCKIRKYSHCKHFPPFFSLDKRPPDTKKLDLLQTLFWVMVERKICRLLQVGCCEN
jgi:hypothetical protein